MKNFIFPFILTTFAAFSTMLGTLLIFFKFKNYNKLIVASLSFASGVMITVSITDLIPESLLLLKENNSDFMSIILCIISIILGIIILMILNYYLPDNNDNTLYKVGIISMLAIIIHNIPEGISISVPIYYATKSKFKAFSYTLISALSEPLGALITYLFLFPFINDTILGLLFSLIAGIMLQISLTELLPISLKYNQSKTTRNFFIIGIIFMLLKFIF